MATPFAFVPRAVSKYTKEWQGISRPPPSPPPGPTTDSEAENDEDDRTNTTLDKVKGIERAHLKQSPTALDIASVISLSLSDYNIWLDADLRWKLDACLNDTTSPDEPGCTSPHIQETSRLINDDLYSRTYQLPPPS